jgi:hypothetical protein
MAALCLFSVHPVEMNKGKLLVEANGSTILTELKALRDRLVDTCRYTGRYMYLPMRRYAWGCSGRRIYG